MPAKALTSSSLPPVFLDEIFLSLQGEGADVGRPHLFLRLAGCPLRCHYCDTPQSWKRRSMFSLRMRSEMQELPNPLPYEQLSELLEKVARSYGMTADSLTLSVTGGEPLEQPDFLKSWLPQWKGKVLLETAGIFPETLPEILPVLHTLSMDWKLSGTLRKGEGYVNPQACLREWDRANPRPQATVKIVIPPDFQGKEVREALEWLSTLKTRPTVFLQPTTPTPAMGAPDPESLLALALEMHSHWPELRVLPQTHPLLQLR